MYVFIKLLIGIEKYGELPTFIIFQEFNYNSNRKYFEHLTSASEFYFGRPPYIFITTSEIFLYCKTCITELTKLRTENLRNLEVLQLYWKEIHGNLNLATVIDHSRNSVSHPNKVWNSNGGWKDTTHDICAVVTLSRRYNFSISYDWELRPTAQKIISKALSFIATAQMLASLSLERLNPFVLIGMEIINKISIFKYSFQPGHQDRVQLQDFSHLLILRLGYDPQ